MREFGKRLKKLRIAAGFSAEDVARRLKVAPSTYREWENGRAIKGEPYVELASILKVSLSELLGLAENRSMDIAAEIKTAEQALQRIRLLL